MIEIFHIPLIRDIKPYVLYSKVFFSLKYIRSYHNIYKNKFCYIHKNKICIKFSY